MGYEPEERHSREGEDPAAHHRRALLLGDGVHPGHESGTADPERDRDEQGQHGIRRPGKADPGDTEQEAHPGHPADGDEMT